MATTLTLIVDWNAATGDFTVRRQGPGADSSKRQAALLGQGDTLKVERGTGWPQNVGLERVDFYASTAQKNQGQPSPDCWDRSSGWQGSTTTWFSGSVGVSGGSSPYVLWVAMEDKELPAQNDSHWYKVTFDNNRVLDPEVINKSGSDPRSGGQWVDVPSAAT